MIDNVSQVAKLYSKLATMGTPKEFNATLPVTLKVLEKLDPLRYLTKIGNATIETKSRNELEIGSKYWAFMGKSSVGTILISNLQKQPKMLDMQNLPLKFTDTILKEFFNESKNPFDNFKNFLLERLSVAQNRDEFMFYSNMFFSIEQNVLTFPMQYEEKDAFFQIRKKKKRESEDEVLEFYAAFSNLGALEGRLMLLDENLNLQLKTPYENTKKLLEENLETCEGVDTIEIILSKNIEPFYEFTNKLLDIKG